MPKSQWTPPPNWPAPPTPGWAPPAGWTPDPAWGPPPTGWNFFPKATGPWPKRHPVWTTIAVVIVVFAIIGGISNAVSGNKKDSADTSPTTPAVAASSPAAEPGSSAPAPPKPDPNAKYLAAVKQVISGVGNAKLINLGKATCNTMVNKGASVNKLVNTAETSGLSNMQANVLLLQSAIAYCPSKALAVVNYQQNPTAGYTVSQQQAIGSAQDYLSSEPGFSKAGLIAQLDSKFGAGFSKKDATFAVNHIKVNWKQQAVDSAKSYLQTSHFSRSGLISQLDSKYGGQFTLAQATYAANKVGL